MTTIDEDEYEYDPSAKVVDILYEDNNKRFIYFINQKVHGGASSYSLDLTKRCDRDYVLSMLWMFDALKCATALLNGEAFFEVDLNLPDGYGYCPLHRAAVYGPRYMIAFLLSHGARTDVPCDAAQLDMHGKLPLQLSLQRLCISPSLGKWNHDQSVLQLVTILCRPQMEHYYLKGLRLLAWSTKETEEEFLCCIRRVELVKVAGLLMVAHKKLIPMLTGADKEAVSTPVLELLLMFERAGDAIEAYSKKERNGDSVEQTKTDVIRLLEEAGIMIEYCIQSGHYGCIRELMPKQFNKRVFDMGLSKVHGRETADALLACESKPLYRWPFSQKNMPLGNLSLTRAWFFTLNEPKNKVKGGEPHLWTISSKKWMSSAVIKRFIKRI